MIMRRDVLAGVGALLATSARAHEILLPMGRGDQTKLLQTAIDLVEKSGGTLELGAGVFRISTLVINGGIKLSGVPGATILESNDDEVLRVSMANASISGIVFKTTSAATKLMFAKGCVDLTVRDCAFLGGKNGISLDACGGEISGNTIKGQEESGIFSIDATGLRIDNNTLSDIGNNGILVWRSEIGEDSTQVTGNRISTIADRAGGSGQNGNGINVYRAGHVLVAENRVTDCAFSGIRNNSGSNTQIIGNSISRAAEVALYVEFAFQGAIVANNMIDDVGVGISITNFDQGGRLAVCSSNVIRNVRGGSAGGETTAAIGIHAEADTNIADNIIEDCVGRGISLGWGDKCRNLSANANVLRNCSIGITVSLTPGSGKMNISNNMLDGCGVNIQGFDYLKPSTGDLTLPEAELPAHLSISGNTVS